MASVTALNPFSSNQISLMFLLAKCMFSKADGLQGAYLAKRNGTAKRLPRIDNQGVILVIDRNIQGKVPHKIVLELIIGNIRSNHAVPGENPSGIGIYNKHGPVTGIE